MVVIQLTEGIHTIRWTLAGYDTIDAQISISATGAVTCLGVTGGSCGSTAPPGVMITGSTVTGYLKAITTPTPTPTPTPAPGANICTWITGLGGWRAIGAFDIMTLVSAYSGQVSLGFTVTAAHIMGTVAYYSNKTSGTADSGNALTGCAFT